MSRKTKKKLRFYLTREGCSPEYTFWIGYERPVYCVDDGCWRATHCSLSAPITGHIEANADLFPLKAGGIMELREMSKSKTRGSFHVSDILWVVVRENGNMFVRRSKLQARELKKVFPSFRFTKPMKYIRECK
jgi:hypothetical protein